MPPNLAANPVSRSFPVQQRRSKTPKNTVTSNRRAKSTVCRAQPRDGSAMRFDVLRLQRLAAPGDGLRRTIQRAPLERDFARALRAAGWLSRQRRRFSKQRTRPTDKPVFEVIMRPEDGLYPLPYMARQGNGQPWETDGTEKNVPSELCRVSFFPDGLAASSKNRPLGVSDEGIGSLLTGKAESILRALPSGGYAKGRSAASAPTSARETIARRCAVSIFSSVPSWLFAQKSRPCRAARVTNVVQRALGSGKYLGAIWLEGSPFVEETTYWHQSVDRHDVADRGEFVPATARRDRQRR